MKALYMKARKSLAFHVGMIIGVAWCLFIGWLLVMHTMETLMGAALIAATVVLVCERRAASKGVYPSWYTRITG